MRVKENQYKYADEKGSYTVCFGDRTIEIKFIGFLSDQLLEKFCHDLGLMLRVIEWQFWGYYGDLTDCDESSTINREILTKLRKRFYEQGCIVEAYTIANPTTIKSIVALKNAEGFENSSIDNNLFPDRSQAIEFIHNVLYKVENKSTKSV